MRILATGATGAVGPRVVSALREAGYRVLVLAMDAGCHIGLEPNRSRRKYRAIASLIWRRKCLV